MIALLQSSAEAAGAPSGYGLALLQTLLSLLAVSALAWVVLRWAAQRGWGQGWLLGGKGKDARIEILERAPLDPRSALYLVRVGERFLLLGRGEGAAPALLAELDPEELDLDPKKIPKDADLSEENLAETPAHEKVDAVGAEGANDE